MQGELTSAEGRLRWLLIGHAVLSGVLAISYIAAGDTKTFAFVANSFAKDILFVILSALGAADVRRFGWTALAIAAGYVALVIGQIATLAWGGPDQTLFGLTVAERPLVLGWMVVDLVLIGWFVAWWTGAVRARHGLRFLHPLAFVSLAAIAEVMLEGRREVLTPEQVAGNVDHYLATLDARGKSRVQVALIVLGLWPMVTLRPPLPALAPSTRKAFLRKRFIEDISERRTIRPIRPLLQAMIRTGAQMSYLGYYGDGRSWESIGYTPYEAREPDGRPARKASSPSLFCLTVVMKACHKSG